MRKVYKRLEKRVCMEKCNSCNVELTERGWTKFKCPDCGKTEVYRCKHCREIAAKYECRSCGFKGPN